MSLPRYPRYKDSGEDWLGEVPEHWEIKPNKSFLSLCRSEVGLTSTEKTLLSLTLRGVIPRDLESGKGKFPADFGAYQDVARDDLVFCLFDIDETPRTVGLAHESGMITGAYDVLRCKANVLPQFVVNYYLHIDSFKGLRPFYTGLRKVVRPPTFMAIKVPMPQLQEQIQIAAFIDRETAKIDALVAEQRRLMALLKEKRQAIISHAVTRGLNPQAPLKPSGIEWLGDVPEHWEVMSLRRCSLRVQTGGTPSSEPPSSDIEDGLVWYTPGDFGDSLRLTVSERKISRSVAESGEAKVFPPRSALIVSIGATLGKVGFAEAASSGNQQINAVIPNNRVDGYFLTYSLLVKSEVMRYLSNASTIGIMNQEKTKDIWLSVPPRTEQENITAYLDAESAKFDTLTTEAQRAIDLLQERRTALISAAVTGQIDVRKQLHG